jgi:hypothetical protein
MRVGSLVIVDRMALPARISQSTKEKRALDFPPDFTTRAFFIASRFRPDPFDFPPEIKRSVVA